MKKFLVILFTLIYLIPAIGVSVDLHWCGKKVRMVSVNSSHETKCPCGTKMPFNCCKDKHLSVKLTEIQKHSKEVITTCNNCKKILEVPVLIVSGKPSSPENSFNISNYHPPPFKYKTDACLWNSVFRI